MNGTKLHASALVMHNSENWSQVVRGVGCDSKHQYRYTFRKSMVGSTTREGVQSYAVEHCAGQRVTSYEVVHL